MPVAFCQRVRAPESVIIRTFDDGESVLLHLETEYYFGLNAVGTRMWQALTESDTVDLAFQVLIAEYDVEPKQLRNDLALLLDELVEQKLLMISTPTV